MKDFLTSLVIIMSAGLVLAQPCARQDADFTTMDHNADGVVAWEEFQLKARQRFDAADHNTDGVLSADELATTRPQFKGRQRGGLLFFAADVDEDRILTRTEWDLFVANVPMTEDGFVDLSALRERIATHHHGRRMGPDTLSLEDLDALFVNADQDGDGEIALGRGQAGRHRSGLGLFVRAADTNQDMSVTVDEWQALLTMLSTPDGIDLGPLASFGRRGTVPQERLDALSVALDLDGDGALTTDDLTQLFQQLDINGDGTISVEEMPGGGRHGRGHGRP